MNQAILLFTFSPIQPFIAEVRRPADAFAASRILSELAKSAGQVFQENGTLVYPASLSEDAPNKLVAIVDQSRAADIAAQADTALKERWSAIASAAQTAFLSKTGPALIDDHWQAIWDRQVDGFPWEIFWVVQNLDSAVSNEKDAYRKAYPAAEKALNALKRLRPFETAEPEAGQKDSLSGVRQALQTGRDASGAAYWLRVGALTAVKGARRSSGERLDAIGVIKRFWPANPGRHSDYYGFPSTSSIASHLYLQTHSASDELGRYKNLLDRLGLPKVRSNSAWPYDGEYLYPDSFSDEAPQKDRDEARQRLRKLYKACGQPPTYYAVVAMDGDDMGARISQAMADANPQAAHQDFSRSLSAFAAAAPDILAVGSAFPVYVGGDDLLFFSPSETALETAANLADAFTQTGSHASAGVAIVHHTFPLSAALRAAHQAEHDAKQFEAGGIKKNAIGIHALKRSGETLSVAAHWDDLPEYFWEIAGWFCGSILSDRFAYELQRSAYFLPADSPGLITAELNRLLQRHQSDDPKTPKIDALRWSHALSDWTASHPGGLDAICNWVLLARFLANGGEE